MALFNSYNPWSYYEANPELKKAVDQIRSGYFNTSSPSLFVEIADHLLHHDTWVLSLAITTTCTYYHSYCLLADYKSYIDCQERVAKFFLVRFFCDVIFCNCSTNNMGDQSRLNIIFLEICFNKLLVHQSHSSMILWFFNFRDEMSGLACASRILLVLANFPVTGQSVNTLKIFGMPALLISLTHRECQLPRKPPVENKEQHQYCSLYCCSVRFDSFNLVTFSLLLMKLLYILWSAEWGS